MVALILDLLVLAILSLSVYLAYRKGLIRTLFSLVGFILSVVLALNLCSPVANWLDKEFVNPAVKETVLTAVNGSEYSENYEDALGKIDVVTIFKDMPEELRDFLESLNVDVDGLVSSAEQSDADSKDAKASLIDSIASPISDAISKTVAIIGLLIIFFGLLLLASRLLDAVFQVLPFGKTINSVGGILFGILRGALLVFIFSAVAYGFSAARFLINFDQLNDTLLLKAINEINPILNAFI